MKSKTLQETLFTEPYRFEFFQAVRLMQRFSPQQSPVGLAWSTTKEPVRFRALPSLTFPPSELYELLPAQPDRPFAQMTLTFFGLYGPSGALPTHYTQLILDLERDVRGEERRSLRDWLDLFNHRLMSLFYRSWEKYRFEVPFERGEAYRRDPDTFTQAIFSLVGLGQPGLRRRFLVAVPAKEASDDGHLHEEVLARIDDLSLLHYGGLLAHRPRNQVGLRAILEDYFEASIAVLQFQGQWLPISPEGQTCLGTSGVLGVDAVAGSKVWEIQSKFRVRMGPLSLERFLDFLPDRSPQPARKNIFLLMHLVRFYVGPEFDFEVQLVLDRQSVPVAKLDASPSVGFRLGWNSWLVSKPPDQHLDDAVFQGEEVTHLV